MIKKEDDMTSNKEDFIAQQELKKKIPHWKCPICGCTHFRMLDGFSQNRFIDFTSKDKMYTIPVVSIGCENCGFISQHALGALGLLDLASTDKKGGKDE